MLVDPRKPTGCPATNTTLSPGWTRPVSRSRLSISWNIWSVDVMVRESDYAVDDRKLAGHGPARAERINRDGRPVTGQQARGTPELVATARAITPAERAQ